LAITPQSAEVIEHLGDVLFVMGETEKAFVCWLKAKELGASSEALDEKIKSKKLQ